MLQVASCGYLGLLSTEELRNCESSHGVLIIGHCKSCCRGHKLGIWEGADLD